MITKERIDILRAENAYEREAIANYREAVALLKAPMWNEEWMAKRDAFLARVKT